MKNLSERIGERVRKKPSCASHANRATVLELRDDIHYALNEGWSILAIYQTLQTEGKVNFSYQAFRRHVNRIILGKKEPKRLCQNRSTNTNMKLPKDPSQGFSFDATPKDGDLF